MILGAGKVGLATLKGLEREVTLGYKVIGFLDDDPEKTKTTIDTSKGSYRVFGQISHFKKFVNTMRVSTIIIAMPATEPLRQARLVNEVQRYVSHVLVIPELTGIALLNTELSVLFMDQLFFFKIRNNLKSLYARIVKRCFDFTVSTVTLLPSCPRCFWRFFSW